MAEEDPFAHTRMTLGEHLEELRGRLIKGLLAIAIAFAGAWVFKDAIMQVATRPYDQAMSMLHAHYVEEADDLLAAHPERKRTDYFLSEDPADERLINFKQKLTFLGPAEGFIFMLKLCLYTSLVIGAPILLWQMWQFVAAGLYPGERRAILGYFPMSLVSFAVGVLFGYFGAVPYGMYFLNSYTPIDIGLPSITAQYFLSFISSLCLAFGFVFQLPLVMTFLGATGMVDPAVFAKYRPHFIVGAFVLGALLTPPDPFTQILMAVPLVVLFEIGIWSARAAKRRRGPAVPPGGEAAA